MDELTLWAYVKSHQQELWQEAEGRRQARLARAHAAQRQGDRVSVLKQFLHVWGFGNPTQRIEAPAIELAAVAQDDQGDENPTQIIEAPASSRLAA
jgi:hypothetical protein